MLQAAQDTQGTVKRLREEAGVKKVNSVSLRPQTLALLSHAVQCRPTRENFRVNSQRSVSRGVTPSKTI